MGAVVLQPFRTESSFDLGNSSLSEGINRLFEPCHVRFWFARLDI
jgi:hypothetical protein